MDLFVNFFLFCILYGFTYFLDFSLLINSLLFFINSFIKYLEDAVVHLSEYWELSLYLSRMSPQAWSREMNILK